MSLGRTLVLAPHPDDETLGCGGVLALLARAGMALHVVLVSDGAASHPHSRTHGPAQLRALRLHEMRRALHELGCSDSPLTTLGLPDGAVPLPGGAAYRAAFSRLTAVVASFGPDSVILPWRGDAHPDHRATHALGAAVCQGAAPQIRLLEYMVWPAPEHGATQPDIDEHGTVWHIDISAVLGRKRRALAQHRSQFGLVVVDDPAGFVLPASLIKASERPVETYYRYYRYDCHVGYDRIERLSTCIAARDRI